MKRRRTINGNHVLILLAGTLLTAAFAATAATIELPDPSDEWSGTSISGPSGQFLKISHSEPAELESNASTEYMIDPAIDIPVGEYTLAFDIYWEDPIDPDLGREELYMVGNGKDASGDTNNSQWQIQYGQSTDGWERKSDTFTVFDDQDDDWLGRLGFVGVLWGGKAEAGSYTYYLDNLSIVDTSDGSVLWSDDFESDTLGLAPTGWTDRSGNTADVFEVVPEPSSLVLIVVAGLVGLRRRR